MSVDDADRLGPKGHVYVELVREQWRAPLERGSARRSLLTATLSVLMIGFGVVGTFIIWGESVILVAIGVVGFVTSMPELARLRPEFEEARRIGWVEPAFDDNMTVGEPASFRAVLHARRKLSLERVTLVAEAREWTGAVPGAVMESLELPIQQRRAVIGAGDDWRESVTFRIPPSAPASFYRSTDSVRWTMTMELEFAEQAPWRRTWPMLVFPADVS
ncbi:MAG: hypothetical protein U5K74_16175 [Gemmatimonadaceae bacterium]|nr:hypothetical protein [Gemmatimonadaceae bacterium]